VEHLFTCFGESIERQEGALMDKRAMRHTEMETVSCGKWRRGPLDYPRRYLAKFAGFEIIVARYQFPSVSILKARNKIGVKMRRRIINIEEIVLGIWKDASHNHWLDCANVVPCLKLGLINTYTKLRYVLMYHSAHNNS